MLIKSFPIPVDIYNFRHLLAHKEDQTLVFMDIETMGLNRKKDPIILIGIMILGPHEGVLHQYFSQNPEDESDILKAVSEIITPESLLITYNGQAFDLPYMNHRLGLHGIPYRFPKGRGIDLMRLAKKALPNAPKYTLKSVEICLGIKREDTLSGAECVTNYETYLKTHDSWLADEICMHNYEDVLHMASLLQLYPLLPPDSPMNALPFYLPIEHSNFWVESSLHKNGYLMIKAGTEHPRSSRTVCYRGSATLQIIERTLDLTLPVAEFSYPLPGSLFVDSDRIPGFKSLPFNELSLDMKMELMVRTDNRFLPDTLTSIIDTLLSQN